MKTSESERQVFTKILNRGFISLFTLIALQCLGLSGYLLVSDSFVHAAEILSTPQVEFVWSGAVTTQSATVKARLINDSTAARLVVSDQPDLSFPIYSNWDTAFTAANNRLVSFALNGLISNRQYYYGVEVGSVVDTEALGKFHTFPPDTGTFTFAFSSCAQTGSSHEVFQTIQSLDPLFFFHLGDLHYQNISVNDVAFFRQAYETVLNSSLQSDLYRNIALAYTWDDHDYGPNNSDSTAPGRTAARLTYQEYVPHYALVAGAGDVPIYQAFTVGRVRFIVCDSRSARSPAFAVDNSAKTVLGVEQKAWFKQELIDASLTHALIVWVNTFPWIGSVGDDGWHLYTYERAELAQFIKDNNITNLCMISGDAHMLAIDDGTNSYYASGLGSGFPVMHAAALDRNGSIKGGPYSHGTYPGPGQFGLMTVVDNMDSIRVDWSGRNHLDSEIVSYSFSYLVGVVSDVEEEFFEVLPDGFSLAQNYPNPFNPTTTIQFELPHRSHVNLTVFNIVGQRIKLLIDESHSVGTHSVTWDGRDESGKAVASGIYFYRIQAGEFVDVKKMTLLK